MHPYGIKLTPKKEMAAVREARKAYEGLPETTCCQRAECCNAGCPNMYYSEFLSIRQGAVDKMSKKDRVGLTVECVRRYLQNQAVPKPCVFLGKDKSCGVYEFRHLKCRLYGLIPDPLYKWIVKSVAIDMNKQESDLPLCTQCDRVKIKPEFRDKFPDGVVPESMIKALESSFRKIDADLGMPAKVQEDGFGFLTYHDWHLMYEMGQSWMAKMTQIRIGCTDEKKELFVNSLKEVLEKQICEEKADAGKENMDAGTSGEAGKKGSAEGNHSIGEVSQ